MDQQIELYSTSHDLQKTDAIYVWNTYFNLCEPKDKELEVLDVGCGDGDVTVEVIHKKLGDGCRLVGADVSMNIVEFARKKHKESENLKFVVMNLEEDIDEEFRGRFDMVFSFYCFHWIQNQRRALENLAKTMKPNGSLILAFLARHPIFKVYEAMSKIPKWAKYTKQTEKYICPFQSSLDPESEFSKLLDESGFKKIVCKIERRSFAYENPELCLKAIMAVNPFISNIPSKQLDAYMRDFLEEAKKLGDVSIDCDENKNDQQIKSSYDLLIVVAEKI